MHRSDHPLLSPSLGCQRTLSAWHFGVAGQGPKIYIQASLHAEELPGMLTAHHLRQHLEALDATGSIAGEIVLVPLANPIGLSQRLDHKPMGRFELDSSENFNRHYPNFCQAIAPQVLPALGPDAQANVRTVRAAMASYLQHWQPQTELQSLRKTLLLLSFDADIVLDLHCDCEGVLHLYCEESCWPTLEPLACHLGCQAVLLAKDSGGGPFDECLSGVWWQLAQAAAAAGIAHPLPQGCSSTTIELRGEADVTHTYAQRDADAILAYLRTLGAVRGEVPPPCPALPCQPTPLAGSQTLRAASPGLLVFAADVGQHLRAGELVAEVIDPLANTALRVLAEVEGVFYARIRDRYVTAGCEIGKIAGAVPFRTGQLLGN